MELAIDASVVLPMVFDVTEACPATPPAPERPAARLRMMSEEVAVMSVAPPEVTVDSAMVASTVLPIWLNAVAAPMAPKAEAESPTAMESILEVSAALRETAAVVDAERPPH